MDEDLDSEPVARVNLTAFGNWTEFNSEDLEEIGLTDLQTVILACLATLIPLTIALITALIARCFWKRYLKRKAIRCQGSLHRIESSDPRHTLQSSCDEMKTSESQFSVIPPEEIAEVMSCYSNGMALNPKSASNGSIITLTMRNNHLIVEREERMPGMAPLPSKCFMSQGDTTIYTVDADDDNLSDYGNSSVSRTTSRDFLIHTQQQPEERHSSGNGGPRSGYSVVPEEYLPFRKAWTEPESEDEGPFVVEEPKAQLPKIEEEFDEGAERRKLDQLQREKQDIQEQIKKYQEILQEAAAAASTTVLPAPQRLNGSLDDFNGERSGSDDFLEDSEGEFVVDDYDEEDVENEENERRQEDERWEAASKILIMNSEHLHDITLQKPPVGPVPVSEKGERTDAEDDWSTGFSEEEDDDQDFQFPRDARDFYRIENRKYDNLAQMQISQEEVPVPASTPADVAARPKGRPEHTQDIVESNAPDRCSPYENVTNIDDYDFSDDDDDDDDDDDKSNQENASVTTEINVGQSLVEKSGESDDEKEKSKSSSSSRGSYQNDYSYGNQSEYTIDMSPSYCKQLVKELLPEPPSPFQNPLKGAPRVEDKTELYCIEKQHQMGKGFKSELSLPGDETFLSRTIISNNLSDSRDLN